jgi:hypothetical protein
LIRTFFKNHSLKDIEIFFKLRTFYFLLHHSIIVRWCSENFEHLPIFQELVLYLVFCPRTRPETFLQCFALEQRESKAKHCRNVLGRILGWKKIDTKSIFQSITAQVCKINCSIELWLVIIITQTSLQWAAGESDAVNLVRFLYICRVLGHLS